jgi:cell wall assembly regulator SMI1
MSDPIPTPYGCSIAPVAAPATNDRVVALETRLGAQLPEDYRAFLLRFNGGKPLPAEFRLASGRSGSDLHTLSALHEGELCNLETKIYLLGPRIPPGVLPIGTDSFGNAICLVLAGERRGQIWFWDHERDLDPPDWSNMDLIADSFDAFMRGLRPDE